MRRVAFFLSASLLVSLVTSSLHAQQKDGANESGLASSPSAQEAKSMSYWMMKKTEVSQAIFVELAKGNTDRIAKLSDELTFLNKVENFVRSKKPGYVANLQTFQFANQELGRQARKGNLEGVALAFHQMTTSCVSCHKLLREE